MPLLPLHLSPDRARPALLLELVRAGGQGTAEVSAAGEAPATAEVSPDLYAEEFVQFFADRTDLCLIFRASC